MPISYKNKIYTTLGTPTELSGNVVSTTDSAGVPAKDYTVKGKSIVWNQMVQNPDFSNTVDDTREYVIFQVQQSKSPYTVFFSQILQEPGLVSAIFTITVSGECRTKHNGSVDDITFYSFNSVKDHKYYICFNFTSVNPTVAGGVTYDKAQIFDLTQMFGAGNEPTTVAEFRAMFPDDYYPYNAGELKTIVPTSVEASGVERFQLLDKNKYPATGVFDGVTYTNNGDGTITLNGTATATTNYNLQSGISVIANHKYFCVYSNIFSGSGAYPLLYTSDPAVFNTGFPMLSGDIITALKDYDRVFFQIKVSNGKTMTNMLVKPQLFDLTQMFGAGNEPATPAEFWQKIPEKLYGYNPSAYKSANIPSSKYFPGGMKSAGSVYDEINFLSQKAIKRVGVRPYQAGDENNTSFITDKKNTVYALSTPVETPITPPLQALSTYKGFTSFSAPNSLTQNGPLSVTYYAEGGASPEKGWLTSYKRKLYMGRNIEWNQLVNYNNFQNQVITNGITFVSNGDGLIVANGTCTGDGASYNIIPWTAVNPAAKFLICGCPQGGSEFTYKIWDTNYQSYKDFGEGCVTGDMEAYSIWINIKSGTTVRDLVFKPQFFNLTKMFGAGNEPSTPEEFWSYFDHKLYPYNAGETQPLFKISRKSYIYKEPAGYTVYFADWVWIADTVTITVEYADGSTATLTSQSDVGGKSYSNIVKMTFTDTDSDRYVGYKMPANGGSEETLYMMPTATLVLTADAEIKEIGK